MRGCCKLLCCCCVSELPSWNLLTRSNTHYEFIRWLSLVHLLVYSLSSSLTHSRSLYCVSPPVDSIWAVMIVWRITGKIIRTVLCCVVYNSDMHNAQHNDMHTRPSHHHHNRFMALFPGPPGWAGARRELLDFMVQGEINRGRHTDHPTGRHSIRTTLTNAHLHHPPYTHTSSS